MAEDEPETPKPKSRFWPFRNTPIAVFFILGNEFCERFMYYGMRAVLMLYLKEELKTTEESGKNFFHGFVFLNYFFPVIGAIVADACVGKYLIILILSIVYLVGATLMAFSSASNFGLPRLELAAVSLFIIALGSGGIKPCVSAFAGDQFPSEATESRDKFYNAFYFAINLGAMLSMILTPKLRVNVKCIPNNENCYPVAFGVPAILMFVAIVLFIIGTPLYNRHRAQGSVVLSLVLCLWRAIHKRILTKRDPKPQHWLDYADDKYDETTISELKAVLHVGLIFTAIPMFWALFDQQGSLWTIQSSRMDGDTIFGQILPDQMDTMNSILVLVFIPLFAMVVYPVCNKLQLLRSPLQRIGTGMFLAALSFLLGGFLYLVMESGYPSNPSSDAIDLAVHNGLPCKVDVTLGSESHPFEKYTSEQFVELNPDKLELTTKIDKANCPNLASVADLKQPITAESGLAYSIVLMLSANNTIAFQQVRQDRQRETLENRPKARFVYVGDKKPVFPIEILLSSNHLKKCILVNDEYNKTYELLNKDNDGTTVCFRDPAVTCDDNACNDQSQMFKFRRGGIYDVIITDETESIVADKNCVFSPAFPSKIMTVLITALPDSVPILIQVPQYVLITAGEIMTSITCLSFAYSESPESTKSVLQAMELLTVSFGNLVVIIIDVLIHIIWSDTYLARSMVFLIYAAFMLLDCVYFVIIAIRYKYVNPLYQKIKE